jgi:hypothetical protein
VWWNAASRAKRQRRQSPRPASVGRQRRHIRDIRGPHPGPTPSRRRLPPPRELGTLAETRSARAVDEVRASARTMRSRSLPSAIAERRTAVTVARAARRGCRTKGPGDQHPQRDSHSGPSDWASALQDERVVDEDDLAGLLIRAARDHGPSSPTSGRHTPRLPANRRRSWTRGGRPNEDSWAMAESDRALQRRKRAIDDLTTEWIAAGTCERATETAFRYTIGIAPDGFEPSTSRL